MLHTAKDFFAPRRAKGRFERYVLTLTAIAGSAAVVGALLLSLTLSTDAVWRYLWGRPLVTLMMFILPLIGGVCGTIELLIGCHAEDLKNAKLRARTPVIRRACAILWRVSSLGAIITYASLLIFSPLSGSATPTGDGQAPLFNLLVLTIPYSIAATAQGLTIFRSLRVQVALWAAYLILLLTLPLRFGSPLTGSGMAAMIAMASLSILLLLGNSWLISLAEDLDEVQGEHRRNEQELIAERAVTTARRRANEFVHDHVLSVLSAIAGHPENSPLLQQAAAEASTVLTGRVSEKPLHDVGDLIQAIQSAFPEVSVCGDEDVRSFHLGGASSSLFSAASEAVGNSLRHGNPPQGHQLAVVATFKIVDCALHVRIVDNGGGFEWDDVTSRGRFGLEHGIRTRLEEIGGAADVRTELGVGTTVMLMWPRATTPANESFSEESRKHWVTGLDGAMVSRVGFAVSTGVLISYCINIWLLSDSFSSVLPSALALVAYASVNFALLRHQAGVGTARPWVVAGVIAIIAMGNLAVLLSLSDPLWPGVEAWTLVLGALLACGFISRGRMGVAWLILGGLAVTTLVWGLGEGIPVLKIGSMLLVPALALLFWSLIVWWTTDVVYDLTAEDEAASRITQERLLQEEIRSRVSTSLESIARRAVPLINPVALGCELTTEVRQEARLLEAELRDGIRALSFVGTPILSAASDARRRGVDVVLLDDSSDVPVPAAPPPSFIDESVRVLDQSTSGRVVIRLLPPSSGSAGTIVSPQGSRLIV